MTVDSDPSLGLFGLSNYHGRDAFLEHAKKLEQTLTEMGLEHLRMCSYLEQLRAVLSEPDVASVERLFRPLESKRLKVLAAKDGWHYRHGSNWFAEQREARTMAIEILRLRAENKRLREKA